MKWLITVFTYGNKMADISLTVTLFKNERDSNNLVGVLKQVTGVTAVHINPITWQIVISYVPQKADTFALVTAVHDAGYSVNTESITLFVGGMTCASCAFHVESALTDIPGVVEADVNLQTGTTTVTIVSEAVSLMAIDEVVQETGYRIYGLVSRS